MGGFFSFLGFFDSADPGDTISMNERLFHEDGETHLCTTLAFLRIDSRLAVIYPSHIVDRPLLLQKRLIRLSRASRAIRSAPQVKSSQVMSKRDMARSPGPLTDLAPDTQILGSTGRVVVGSVPILSTS